MEDAITSAIEAIAEKGEDLSPEQYLGYLEGVREELNILIDASKHDVRSKRGA